MSPPYTVVLYLVNSDLRCLVITTLDSIYVKKNSEIRYSICVCLQRTVSPPRSAATITITLSAFPFDHKQNPYSFCSFLLHRTGRRFISYITSQNYFKFSSFCHLAVPKTHLAHGNRSAHHLTHCFKSAAAVLITILLCLGTYLCFSDTF